MSVPKSKRGTSKLEVITKANELATHTIHICSIDYVTGLLVAGVFHNSGKTENGALESRAGWKGLCRKCITLLMVLVATRLDLVTGTNFIRDAVVIAFIANETISIVENAGLMGINIPPAITSAIEVLKKKSDSADNTDQ